MWFPTDMAVFDFTVEITGFGPAEQAHPLVRVIAETLDRLGSDHLLAELSRDGATTFSEIYPGDSIMINGSTREPYAFEGRIRAEARRIIPDAEVTIDWREHDEEAGVAAAVNREIERVSRMFRGLARGAVPARVRLAILNPGVYLSQFGVDRDRVDPSRPADLTLAALYAALSDIGAVVGLDWKTGRQEAERAFGNLRVLPAALDVAGLSGAGSVGPLGCQRCVDEITCEEFADYADYASFVDRWVAADEAELAAADPTDPLYAEVEEHLRAVLAGSVRDALDGGVFERGAAPSRGSAAADPIGASSHSSGRLYV